MKPLTNKQVINQYDDNNLPHGYYEEYFSNGQIFYKGNWINGRQTGYWEWYHKNNSNELYEKEYIII
jgi:hypothetical protein